MSAEHSESISKTEKLHNNKNNYLWQVVLFLGILVAVTVALVAACLYQFIHHSDYEIQLYQGLVSSSKSSAGTSGNGVVSTQSEEISGSKAKVFDFQVSDDENVWSNDTSIELFHTSYTNDLGQVTVQSENEDSVVAPGTSGSYTFSLKNASKLDSNYQVWLEAGVNVTSSEIPIEFRISGEDGWLTGEDGAWKTAYELNAVVEKKNLYAGKSAEYTLYWRWAFDRNEDEQDTSYGNVEIGQDSVSGGEMNISQEISYEITLHTLAAEGLIQDGNSSDDPDNNGNDSNNGSNGNNDSNHNNNNTGNSKDNDTDINNGNNANNKNQNNTGSQTGTTANDRTDQTSRTATKTGDDTPILKWFFWLCTAVVCMAFVVAGKLRERKHKAKGQDKK